jgi:hypothetical protein
MELHVLKGFEKSWIASLGECIIISPGINRSPLLVQVLLWGGQDLKVY